MSIILDALKKARRDRRVESDLRDDALFRQPNYENGKRPHKEKKDYGRMILIGCLSGIFLLLLAVVIGGYVLYKGKIFATLEPTRQPHEKNAISPTPYHIDEPTRETIVNTKIATTEPTASASPIPTPTPIIEKNITDNKATPIQPTPTPTLQPSPTPTPSPSPTPRPIISRPSPTPNATPKATTPAPPRSEFQRPEDYSIETDGVMWDDKNPSALINGQIIGVGQTVDEWVLRRITKEYIEIEKDNVKYKFKY